MSYIRLGIQLSRTVENEVWCFYSDEGNLQVL